MSPVVPRPSPHLPARDAVIVLALAALPLLAVVGGGFVADDFFFVTVLERTATPWFSYLAGAVTATYDIPTTFYRPLAMASLLADLRMWGSDPWALHVVNLALHAVAALATWGIARRLVAGPQARAAALVAAVAWAWFPRRVEAVAWISCRPDLLATALAALGLWVWVEGARLHRTPLRALGVLLWGAALFAKESVVALPLALVAWPALDGRVPAGDVLARFTRTAARAVALWPFVVMGGVYFAFRYAATGAIVGGYGETALTFSFTSALKHLVYPALPPLEFLNRVLVDPGAFLPAAIVVAVVGGGLWTTVALTSDRPAVAFGALWWLAAALPVLPLPPSLTTTFNDRLMYLSGIGLALVLAGWWAGGRRPARVAIALFVLATTAKTLLTAARWPVAGAIAARIVEAVAAEAAREPVSTRIAVATAPDTFRGAYILRTRLDYALQRAGVALPGRAGVLSPALLEQPTDGPVDVEAVGPDGLRLRGRNGRPEVMMGNVSRLATVTGDSGFPRDRYGRYREVVLRLDQRALVLTATGDGVRSLGVLGPPAFADPQLTPRVGPKE